MRTCFLAGQTLFTADVNGQILGWSMERAEVKSRLLGHTDVVLALCSLPRLGMLASASADATVRLWDTVRGTAS